VILLLFNLTGLKAAIAAAPSERAFSEKFMFRLSSYGVLDADTDMAVLSSEGIGTGFSYSDDLGGDDSATTPRIDAYYRFNKKHRIEFTHFRIERDGSQLITIDLDIGDESYNVGDTVVSSIDYELFKIDYAYSFYHSPTVELIASAGLNLTAYEFEYERADGSSADASEVTGPLPMFGLEMSYAISPKWTLHYLSEAFFISIGDELEGAFQNFEINIEYRIHKHFVLGGGAARFSTDLDARDSNWKGRLADSHRALLLYASYYL
jgi:hypothetical protein